MWCYQAAELRLFGKDIMDGSDDHVVKSFREDCNCLPACTSILYEAEIDRAKIDWTAAVKTNKHFYMHTPG